MNCSICFDLIEGPDLDSSVGCGYHHYHSGCLYSWTRNISLKPKSWKECFICHNEFSLLDIQKIYRIANDPFGQLIKACIDNDLDLFKSQLDLKMNVLREREYIELLKMALDSKSLDVTRYLKQIERHHLLQYTRENLIYEIYRNPSSTRLSWILDKYWVQYDFNNGRLSPEIVTAFVNYSAYSDLYKIFVEEFPKLALECQVDILTILFEALCNRRWKFRGDWTNELHYDLFFRIISLDNREFCCHYLGKVLPLVFMNSVKDWDTFKESYYDQIVCYCRQCETKQHYDESVVAAIKNDNEPFLKMLVQYKEFQSISKLELRHVATMMIGFCESPMRFKKIFEFCVSPQGKKGLGPEMSQRRPNLLDSPQPDRRVSSAHSPVTDPLRLHLGNLLDFCNLISKQCTEAAEGLSEAHLDDQIPEIEETLKMILGHKGQLESLKTLYSQCGQVEDPEKIQELKENLRRILEAQVDLDTNRLPEMATFKRKVFEAGHPDEALPSQLGEDNMADDDSDADLIVAETRQSTKCPLSQTTFVEPMKNPAYGHVYSKQAIVNLARASSISCPIAGCRHNVRVSQLVPDLEMERRLERSQNRIFN